MENVPKSLGIPEYRQKLLARLHEPHVKDLTEFVERIREEQGCGDAVPYCDPADGGINAKCLIVLEAPGPKAVGSGFVSRNNPDESAKNWLELNVAAGLPRSRTATWNIVPWYIGSEGKIRPASPGDIASGWPYLERLLRWLPGLRIVVLVGRKAQRVATRLRSSQPDLEIMKCYHPSPMFVNRKPENRNVLLEELRKVAGRLS